MPFGISGDDTRTFMVGADVVVTWIDRDETLYAIDYHLNARQQMGLAVSAASLLVMSLVTLPLVNGVCCALSLTVL